jgi:hypothetical protein
VDSGGVLMGRVQTRRSISVRYSTWELIDRCAKERGISTSAMAEAAISAVLGTIDTLPTNERHAKCRCECGCRYEWVVGGARGPIPRRCKVCQQIGHVLDARRDARRRSAR